VPPVTEAATLRIAGGRFSGVAVYSGDGGEVRTQRVSFTSAGVVFDD
jgi:hypothetical protein